MWRRQDKLDLCMKEFPSLTNIAPVRYALQRFEKELVWRGLMVSMLQCQYPLRQFIRLYWTTNHDINCSYILSKIYLLHWKQGPTLCPLLYMSHYFFLQKWLHFHKGIWGWLKYHIIPMINNDNKINNVVVLHNGPG